MKTSVLLLVLMSHFVFSVKHSLKYIYIGSSGLPDFPEFSAAAVVDETMVAYCDTKIHVKEDWMKSVFDNDPQQQERYTQECLVNMPSWFRATIHNLKQRFNQSGGVHIVQTVTGCEWDDETGEVNGFDQYGYDGEDFLSFDQKTSTWIASRPQAFSTKLNWDADKNRENRNKFYFTKVYPEWLKTYIKYAKKALTKSVVPSVSLLQKSPSSPVTCHATGFFPDRAVMFWRRDGEELQEDVDHGEILPNHDGTFQMSVDLLKPPAEDWRSYECVFQLSGVKEDIISKLHKDVIRTNHEDPTDVAVVVGVSLLLLLLLVAVGVGFVFYRQRKATKRRETSNPETTSMNPPSRSEPDRDQEEETLTSTEGVKQSQLSSDTCV
ncbi:major histocompatibility complex class I-related protein 1-like [Halichoeres trimaculatus]|uniref:major histocompatibility complex class I-related protein 1-like n=1 Tax=Halichoeres trimaculatus TaxID=147232 RepID=UPI003D9E3EEB